MQKKENLPEHSKKRLRTALRLKKKKIKGVIVTPDNRIIYTNQFKKDVVKKILKYNKSHNGRGGASELERRLAKKGLPTIRKTIDSWVEKYQDKVKVG